MNFFKWLITIVVCLVIFAGLATFKFMDIRQSIAEAEAYPEQSETVEEAFISSVSFTPETTVIGEIIAPRRLDMRNEIAGEITRVNFTSGEYVESGQLLIQLDTSVEEANLEVAQARAILAKQVFDRTKELSDGGIATRDDLDRASAELTAAEAEIRVLERTIDRKTLTAPFAGRAGLHTFEPGQYLMSNTLITSLVGDTPDMWVDFQVPQFYPPLPLGGEVELRAITDNRSRIASATIIAENTVLNANNRSRSYRASLQRDDAYFGANAMAEIMLPVGDTREVVRVPSLAIQNDPLGQFIYLLDEDSASQAYRARRQQVRVIRIEDGYALLEPAPELAEGTRIAGAGAFKLYEGLLVHTGQRQGLSPEQLPVENPALIGEQQ